MPDAFGIRPARAADADAIDAVIRAAFAGTEFGYQGEAELVRMLEADGDALASLVATRDGVIIGHVLFSRMDVEADGAPLSAAGLAPVSVVPDAQGQGVGAALIRAGLAALGDQGVAISFVLGHEAYYPRFGYSPALAALRFVLCGVAFHGDDAGQRGQIAARRPRGLRARIRPFGVEI